MSVAWPAAGWNMGWLHGRWQRSEGPALLSPLVSCDPWQPVLVPAQEYPHPRVLPCHWASWPWAGVSLAASACGSCPERAGLIYPRPASVSASASPSPAEQGRACTGPGRGVLKPEYSRVSFTLFILSPGF